MGVFSRFKDIVNANITSMLDKAENPEKMIRLMMQEMEDTLIDLKSSCAAKMAAKAKAEREYRDVENLTSRWQKRAELAISKGRDDLAREALVEKRKASNELTQVQEEIAQHEKAIEECKANIIQLEEKLQTVRQKHKVLVQRSIQANEQKKVRETIKKAADNDAYRRFSDLESRIERMEAEVELGSTQFASPLEDEFTKLETHDEVDDELMNLKASLKKTTTKKPE